MQTPKHRSFRVRMLLVIALSAIALAVYFWIDGSSPKQSTVSTNSPTENDGVNPAPSPLPAVSKDAVGATKQIAEANDVLKPPMGSVVDGRTLATCHRALLQKRYMETFSCDKIKADDVIGLRLCQDALADNYAIVQQLAAESAHCSEKMAMASEYYKALRDAALGGDENARRCFIQGYFSNREGGDAISQEQRDEYVTLAGTFIESSIEDGDWGLVRWLGRTNFDVADGMLRRAYPFGREHPDTTYKMNFLLQLSGRYDNGAGDVRDIVKTLRSNGRLSSQQIEAAEEWARETYSKYFAATPNTGPNTATSFCPTM